MFQVVECYQSQDPENILKNSSRVQKKFLQRRGRVQANSYVISKSFLPREEKGDHSKVRYVDLSVITEL